MRFTINKKEVDYKAFVITITVVVNFFSRRQRGKRRFNMTKKEIY